MTDLPAGDALAALPVPQDERQIDAEWLSAALGRPVGRFRLTRIGESRGFTGAQVLRLHLDDAPETRVLKLGPPALAAANAREIAAYRGFRGAPGLPVPRCDLAAFDPVTGASVLLLEDLSACRTQDFVTGCGLAEAVLTARALARCHAHPGPDSGPGDAGAPASGIDMAALWPDYPARLAWLLPDMTLPPRLRALGDWLARDGGAFLAALARAEGATRLHGDAQIDNVLFCPDRGAVLIDWHFCATGRGGLDLGHFLISSLDPALRRAEQARIVAAYRAALKAEAPGLETDLRLAAALKLAMSVMATLRLSNDGPARRAWRRTDLTRLIAFCEDHRITPDDLAAAAG